MEVTRKPTGRQVNIMDNKFVRKMYKLTMACLVAAATILVFEIGLRYFIFYN